MPTGVGYFWSMAAALAPELEQELAVIRARFVWLGALVGLELGALAALFGGRISAGLIAFFTFAVTHDWGRVLKRSPRLENLVRARDTARMLAVALPLPWARQLPRLLEAPGVVAFAAADPAAARGLAGRSLEEALIIARAASTLGRAGSLGFVLTVMGLLSAVASPGLPDPVHRHAAPLIAWMLLVGLPQAVLGGLARLLLRDPTQKRLAWARRLAYPLLGCLPFGTAAAAQALWLLRGR